MSKKTEMVVNTASEHPSLSSVVVPLLKGVVYQETAPDVWNALLDLQPQVRDYVAVVGLELHLSESEGYAFLRSKPEDDSEESVKYPRLIARRALSFPVSLLLALLRKKMAEFDATGSENTRLVVSREEIAEMIRVFLPDGSNEARLIDQVDAHIGKVEDLGFVRGLRGQGGIFEVRRILKAYVDAQWLSDFDERLAAYRASLESEATNA